MQDDCPNFIVRINEPKIFKSRISGVSERMHFNMPSQFSGCDAMIFIGGRILIDGDMYVISNPAHIKTNVIGAVNSKGSGAPLRLTVPDKHKGCDVFVAVL